MEEKPIRQGVKRSIIKLFGIIILLLLLTGLAGFLSIDVLVDMWWFDALGYQFYFWQRMLYRYVIFASVSLFFFLIFFLNFRVASRALKRIGGTEKPKDEDARPGRIAKAFRTGSSLFYLLLSIALSIFLSLPFYQHWERFLFYIFGSGMEIKDPFFATDVSFYLFSFPIYSLLQRRLLLALLVLLGALFLLYVIRNRFLERRLFEFSGVAKWHLSLVVLAVFGVGIGYFILQRYALVYDPGHQPLFSGPGFVQMNVILPLIWISLALTAVTGVLFVILLLFRKGFKPFVAVVLLLALSLTARHTHFLSRTVESYWVKPNEIAKESPYIKKNIDATLDAYHLSDLETRNFTHRRFPVNVPVENIRNVLRNIPVWDAVTLEMVFEQLQELRTYYTFPKVSVGRYTVNGDYQQIFMSLRELNYDNLPGETKNWINNHLLYTHGYGAVMTPASQVSGDSITWFINNIPQESDYGFSVAQPRIYYGLQHYPYAVAPNKVGELDYPQGNSNVKTNYQGKGGVPVSSLARKLMLSYYFRDKNIFLSTRISSDSKILFRRQIVDRVQHLAPFLRLDQTPYAVVTSKGLFWIVDAYTTSKWYPSAPSVQFGDESLNYIRNSVKIVVDAYNGTADFYIYDENDPIAAAYNRIYPGFFKSKQGMPPALRPHVRYPQDLFEIQMQIYAKYHQTDAQVFFQQEDLWTGGLEEETTVPQKPYYLTLDLITSGKLDFILMLPMFPKGRDNLRSMAVAGCDGDNYGRIIVYEFPKGELVYGPAQINALINQDPDIAQQFTLWDQIGSSVSRGKMIILPVENSVFFIQPVYLKATSRVKIPELQRIIMSEGMVAVMETSLEDAYTEIQRRVQEGGEAEVQPLPETPAEPIPQAAEPPETPPESEPEDQTEQPPPTESPPEAAESNEGQTGN